MTRARSHKFLLLDTWTPSCATEVWAQVSGTLPWCLRGDLGKRPWRNLLGSDCEETCWNLARDYSLHEPWTLLGRLKWKTITAFLTLLWVSLAWGAELTGRADLLYSPYSESKFNHRVSNSKLNRNLGCWYVLPNELSNEHLSYSLCISGPDTVSPRPVLDHDPTMELPLGYQEVTDRMLDSAAPPMHCMFVAAVAVSKYLSHSIPKFLSSQCFWIVQEKSIA